jgi:hypothetical protein
MTKGRIAHIDSLLLSNVTMNWRKAARIVGSVFIQLVDEGLAQTGDMILFARLRALIKAGLIVANGNTNHVHLCEVRLPESKASARN